MKKYINREHIVVIGGGFAGLKLVKHLDKNKFRITIVDEHNYHSFPPLFYQIASAGIEPASICFPLRAEIKRYIDDGVRFRMMHVCQIDIENKTISGGGQHVGYDKLVIAAGTTNNFFGIKGMEDKVFTLKSTPEALRTRNEVLGRLEAGAVEKDPEKRRELLRFVVVGGGPTGVETAGALGEMKRYILQRQYPEISPDDVSIVLIEGADRLLGAMSDESSVKALKYLKELNVDIFTGVALENYENGVVKTNKGNFKASMVIWTAGITTVGFDFVGGTPEYGRGHRIMVDGMNRIKGIDDLYALGDICLMESDLHYPQGHPQLAQVAIQQADNLARNLNSSGLRNEMFAYKDKGSMATVGRNRAVVDLPKFHYGGFPAWLTWMFIHLMSILGIRNKITVFINWAWGYFTYGSSLRMLFRVSSKPRENIVVDDE